MFKLSDSASYKKIEEDRAAHRRAVRNRQNNRKHRRARERRREWKATHPKEEQQTQPQNAMDVVKAVSAKRKAAKK